MLGKFMYFMFFQGRHVKELQVCIVVAFFVVFC